eukprot:1331252-Amorphochlora_amoeboformis.AAC.2
MKVVTERCAPAPRCAPRPSTLFCTTRRFESRILTILQERGNFVDIAIEDRMQRAEQHEYITNQASVIGEIFGSVGI